MSLSRGRHARKSGTARVSAGLVVVGAGLAAWTLVAAQAAYAAQPPVGLGAAKSFAVLAGSGITNTGPTSITGDVGSFPTTSQTGFNSVTLVGTNHRGDSVTQQAKTDLVRAYNDAAGRTPATPRAVELGGATLQPGVYRSPTFGLTGTLTLDAAGDGNAVFIFQAGSTLIAEVNSAVRLINGASPCNVFWKVGSSATFKTGTRFVGSVLALTSISAGNGAVFQGRLLARNGAVTMNRNTISNARCVARSGSAAPTPTPAGTPTAAPRGPAVAQPVGPLGDTPTLPLTGAPPGRLVWLGLAMVALGSLSLATGRRWAPRLA